MSRMRTAAAALAAMILSGGAALADFRGGGALFGFTQTCAQQGWPVGSTLSARIRHAPQELYGNPSQVTIALAGGTQHLAVWQPFVPSTQVFDGLARQVWTNFLLNPTNPRVRIVQRRITARVNPALPESVGNAQEMFLRLRIENFNNLVGCSVTLAANLRRF